MDSKSASASPDGESAKNLKSSDDGGASTHSQSNSSQYVWSDRKCFDIASEKSFPKAVKTLAIQKNIITRFLNFYLGAKVQKHKGVSVTDLVFSVISITPLHPKTEEFMWDDEHYHDEGNLFSLTLDDVLSVGTDKEANENDEVETDQHYQEESNTMPNDAEKDIEDIGHDNEILHENKIEGHDIETSTIKIESEFTEKQTKEDNLKHVENNATKHQENNESLPKQEDGDHPNVSRKFPTDTNIVWFSNKLPSPNAKADLREYGPMENAAFTSSVNQLLEMWDSSQEARIALKYFFGFVALTLLRGTTKTFKHLVNAFSNVRFFRYLHYIRAFSLGHLKYSVPHKRCIKSCYRTFRKRDENLRVMFAKVVINSFIIESKSREPFGEQFPPNIMKVAVLTHTAGYGLGLINMIENVAKRTIDLPFLVESTRCKETEPYWEKIITFFEKYMTAKANEHTHYWSRVIDGNFFKDLSCVDNYPLAVVLAVFIEKLSDGREAGIWQSTWVTKGENLEYYKKIGHDLYIQYREKKRETFFKTYIRESTMFREFVSRKVAEYKENKEKGEPSTSVENKENKESSTNEDSETTEQPIEMLFSDKDLEKLDVLLKEFNTRVV